MNNVTNKKKAVVSYERMSEELAKAFAEKYPKGYSDYFPDIQKYDKPDGTSFYAVTIEIPDAVYLVKVNVKTDDYDDVENWLNGTDDGGDESAEGEDTLPDNDIAQYGEGEGDE